MRLEVKDTARFIKDEIILSFPNILTGTRIIFVNDFQSAVHAFLLYSAGIKATYTRDAQYENYLDGNLEVFN